MTKLLMNSLSDLPHSNHYQIDFVFHFNFLSLLIITKSYKELLRLTSKDIVVHSIIHSYYSKNEITVRGIKVDDQNPYEIYPSVFQITSVEDKPAVSLKIESFGTNKYGGFEIEIQPITVRVDLSFITDIVGEILFSKGFIEDEYDKYSVKKSTQLKIVQMHLISKYLKFHYLKKLIILFQRIRNITSKKSLFILSLVNFRSKQQQEEKIILQTYYLFYRLVGLIRSLNNISISISDSYIFSNLSGTTADIKKLILHQLSLKNIIHESKNMVVDAAKNIIQLG